MCLAFENINKLLLQNNSLRLMIHKAAKIYVYFLTSLY